MKITDDAGYNKALEWMVERAQMIANPLLDEKQRAEHMRKYDLVTKEVRVYSRKKTASVLPYMRDAYGIAQQEEPKTALAEWLE